METKDDSPANRRERELTSGEPSGVASARNAV